MGGRSNTNGLGLDSEASEADSVDVLLAVEATRSVVDFDGVSSVLTSGTSRVLLASTNPGVGGFDSYQ